MKNLILLFFVLLSFTAKAQIDTIINYNDSLIYEIDTTVYYGNNDSSVAPNYVKFEYHYISPGYMWESQLIIVDSVGKWLVPVPALIGSGASGTTYFTKLDSASVLKPPLELCDSLFLLKYNLFIGTTTKL